MVIGAPNSFVFSAKVAVAKAVVKAVFVGAAAPAATIQLMPMKSPSPKPWALTNRVFNTCPLRVARAKLLDPAVAATPVAVTTPGATSVVVPTVLKDTPAGRVNVKSSAPILAGATNPATLILTMAILMVPILPATVAASVVPVLLFALFIKLNIAVLKPTTELPPNVVTVISPDIVLKTVSNFAPLPS